MALRGESTKESAQSARCAEASQKSSFEPAISGSSARPVSPVLKYIHPLQICRLHNSPASSKSCASSFSPDQKNLPASPRQRAYRPRIGPIVTSGAQASHSIRRPLPESTFLPRQLSTQRSAMPFCQGLSNEVRTGLIFRDRIAAGRDATTWRAFCSTSFAFVHSERTWKLQGVVSKSTG